MIVGMRYMWANIISALRNVVSFIIIGAVLHTIHRLIDLCSHRLPWEYQKSRLAYLEHLRDWVMNTLMRFWWYEGSTKQEKLKTAQKCTTTNLLI